MEPRPQPPVVMAHPFVAFFRVESPTPSAVTGGRLCRDSQGRKRVDYYLVNGQEVRFIDDVATNTLFVMDVGSSSYEKNKYTPANLGWMFANVTPIYTEEHSQIHGIDCVRIRFTPPRKSAGDLGEAWISKPLGIVMKDENPSEGWKWEITSIEFREPDPATFELPRGFDEIK